jgi:hypothetical protein
MALLQTWRRRVMAEIGWSGVLVGAIFIADIVVFLGLIREDRRARQSKDRRAV